jgi:hypothetical protein
MADALGETFSFNREAYQFNAELRQQQIYLTQKMRIKQVDLYRQDLKHLFGLTIGKMNNYTIINTVMLGLTCETYFKGRLPDNTNITLYWLWCVSISFSAFNFLLSLWLALHASIFAQTYSVRSLTQWLRLPIPSEKEIMSGVANLEEFEHEKFESMFRMPVIGSNIDFNKDNRLNKSKRHDLSTEYDLFTRHFTMFNKLHIKYQSHEAYARVSMSTGIIALFHSLSYYALSYYSVSFGTPLSGFTFTLLFTFINFIHSKLSFNLSRKSYNRMLFLLIAPGIISIALTILLYEDFTSDSVAVYVLSVILLFLHFLWSVFFLVKTKSDKKGLPLKFSTVWCIDILGFGINKLVEVVEPSAVNPIRHVKTYTEDGPVNSIGEGEDQEEVMQQRLQVLVQSGKDLTAEERIEINRISKDLEHKKKRQVTSDNDVSGWMKLDDGYSMNLNTGEIKLAEENLSESSHASSDHLPVPEESKYNTVPYTIYSIGSFVTIIAWIAAIVDISIRYFI